MKYSLGIDIGYSSIKLAVINDEKELVFSKYILHKGKVKEILKEFLCQVLSKYSIKDITSGAVTGEGCEFLGKKKCAEYVNDVIAVVEGTLYNNKNVKSIIEFGGQSSKFINGINENNRTGIKFSMNSNCSAGTGSFLEEQISRLKLKLDDFSKYTDKATAVPRIAGRCSVFAKTDIIHHQQEGTSIENILIGLCYAVVRNYKNVIVKRMSVDKPVAFVGGVVKNKGIMQAIQKILKIDDKDLIISNTSQIMGAIGSAVIAQRNNMQIDLNKMLDVIEKNNDISLEDTIKLPPLYNFRNDNLQNMHKCTILKNREEIINCYLGVDVGSTSTNIVLMDENNEIITYRYLKTKGNPIDVVKEGLLDVKKEIGHRVNIIGAGTTGSGRYLIGDLIGADIVKDEITAQAKAAITIDSEVDTVIEIGGQDSKFIRIEDGVVVDFEMNKVCAAGTGSFIEEQAKKLNVDINNYYEISKKSNNPIDLGERCTVFVETNIVNAIAKGAGIQDILAGLCYSIAKNYLNRVVGSKKIGNKIFFQGGVVFNQGVVNAFRAILGDKVFIPPFFSVTGAYGACLLAKEEMKGKVTKFRGLDINKVEFKIENFVCNKCSNMCQIRKINIDNTPRFYGARCDIYEREFKKEKVNNKNIFKTIEKMFLEKYSGEIDKDKKTIGIPKVLIMCRLFPLFNVFFKELGFNVLLSEPTNGETVRLSQEYSLGETCYPVKLINGSVAQFLNKEVDYIFLPSLYTMKHMGSKTRENYACNYMMTASKIVNEVMDLENKNIKLLDPVLSFNFGKDHVMKSIIKLAKPLNRKPEQIIEAFQKGIKYFNQYNLNLEKIGQDFIKDIKPDEKVFVMITRGYNIVDSELSMKIPQKLIKMGYKVMPPSVLPISEHSVFEEYPNMYWPFGQHNLSAAQIVRQHPNLHAINITNHGCGPDTILAHYVREEMKGKPYLHIEVDEHSSDVGVNTRIEAFVNSLKKKDKISNELKPLKYYSNIVKHKKTNIETEINSLDKDVNIYIPYIYPYSQIVKAILNKEGINVKVLEMTDKESLNIGRKFTITKEYPSLVSMLGDVFKKLNKDYINEKNITFLIPTSEGSEVYGQYSRILRTKLDEYGYNKVKIVSPYIEDIILGDINLFKTLSLGILCGDIIMSYKYENRKEVLEEIIEKIENNNFSLEMLKKNAMNIYKESKLRKERANISIIGTPDILFNDFMNGFIFNSISNKNIQVNMQPMSEVLYFSWNDVLKNIIIKGNIEKANIIKERLMWLKEKMISISDILKDIGSFEENIDELINKADTNLQYYSGGIGRYRFAKLLCASKRADGIINSASLYENTSTILSILSEKLRENSSIPIIDLNFDGEGSNHDKVKLDTFIYYLKNK